MLFASGRPRLGAAIPAALLVGLILTFWRLSHNNYIDPSGWLRTKTPLPPTTAATTDSKTPPKSPPKPNAQTNPSTSQNQGIDQVPFRKVIVMGSLAKEDTTWVGKELPDWEQAIYVTDAKEAGRKDVLTVPKNKGNEANVYLYHIIQHYHDLPELMVFLHSHRDSKHKGWHIDNKEHSNPQLVQNLHLDTVLNSGFVNLRCTPFPGCPKGLVLDWNTTGEARLPDNPEEVKTKHVMPAAFNIMFPNGLDTENYTPNAPPVLPPIIAAPCCAQFAVSKAQVLSRPRSDYERYHKWLMASELNNWTSGRVMEYLWHIIFGRPAYYCPDMRECNAKVYGIG